MLQCTAVRSSVQKNYGPQNTRTDGKVPGRKISETHTALPHSRGRFSQLGRTLLVLALTPDVTGQVAGQTRNLEYRRSNETSWSC